MPIQYINTGSSANAGNGDSLRAAFTKVNNNFSYLSTASFGSGGTGYTGSIGYTGSRAQEDRLVAGSSSLVLANSGVTTLPGVMIATSGISALISTDIFGIIAQQVSSESRLTDGLFWQGVWSDHNGIYLENWRTDTNDHYIRANTRGGLEIGDFNFNSNQGYHQPYATTNAGTGTYSITVHDWLTNTTTNTTWTFNADSTIKLPPLGDILDSDGNSVLSNGSAARDRLVTNGQALILTTSTTTANTLVLGVTNSTATSITIGSDTHGLNISNDGNISIFTAPDTIASVSITGSSTEDPGLPGGSAYLFGGINYSNPGLSGNAVLLGSNVVLESFISTDIIAIDLNDIPNSPRWSFQTAGLVFPDSTVQTTAYTGQGSSGNGYTGSRGAQGVQGPQGVPGAQGIQGIQGPQGIPGPIGNTGTQGIQGNTGTQGIQGVPGAQGIQGIIGNTGTQGPRGFTGAQGISVTLVGSTSTSAGLPEIGNPGDGWIVTDSGDLWFWSTAHSQWEDIGPIVGPQGDVGDQGPTGPQGAIGNTGTQGIQGIQGPTGPQGIQGPQGNTGTQGAQGIQGIQGIQGESGSTSTRWDAVPLVEGCPIYAELTPDHFYAYTQQSHLNLQNNGYWDIGSGRLGNGVQGYFDGNTTVYSTGTVTVRSGWFDQHEWTFDTDGNLAIPGGINKDGQTVTITVTETSSSNTATIIGIASTATALLLGSEYQGIAIQTDGSVIVQSRQDSESPVTLIGGFGISEGVNGGDVLIAGGFSDSGVFGSVLIEGQYLEISTIEGLVINYVGNGWFFDNNDFGLEFPDATKQYTAWQGSTIVSDIAPTDDLGRIWFNSVDGRAYVKYNDLWTDLSPVVVPDPTTYLDGLTIDGTTIGVLDSTSTQTVSVAGNIEPIDTLTYNLGSPTKQWNALYVSSSTIYMSGRALSLTGEGLKIDGQAAITVLDGGDASTWLTAV